MRLSLLRPRRPLVVLVAAMLCAVVTLSASAASAEEADARPGVARPTVVLVHGAWADGSGWNAVVARLQRDGYPVRVPPNPLRGLAGDSATVAAFVSTIPGPVILVGHSYGGAVITNAAAGLANVKALVYVDAFAPARGETVLPLAGADSALAADPTTVFDFVPYPGAPEGDVDLYLKRDVFLTSFANGVPRADASLLYATQRPITYSAGNVASGAPAYETIPSWYLVGTRDKIITPARQRFMARRAKATTVEVGAGHLAMVTHPDAVGRLIQDAARTTR
ncbi:alpha/beta fold hydrolase [Parafrankia discariae]|uniref:alpha/beta fold hydrolase n=1 Tax=Parafrankia discariae TaxID=365528 RepID=UPI00035D1ED1|nr:alpha/beta hydrolase [Parafrankia discariae]